MSSGLGVEGIEGDLKVFSKFVKGLVRGFDGRVGHFVIPHFSKGGASSFAHLVKDHYNFIIISRVEYRIDGKVGFHGIDSL